MAATASPERISEMQEPLREPRWHPPMSGRPLNERTRLRRRARWWELEALRGYDWAVDEYGMNSADRSRMYAANQRWLVELMDAGVVVIGRRFDAIVKEHSGMSWDDFVRRHAERICGDRYVQKRKR
jgi:hypothetical protein